ncbi:hypothetical protein KR009_006794 [Drosophila setifemur]|nr:hypothetical protein KR009_006794 [Drosophila setifemur]
MDSSCADRPEKRKRSTAPVQKVCANSENPAGENLYFLKSCDRCQDYTVGSYKKCLCPRRKTNCGNQSQLYSQEIFSPQEPSTKDGKVSEATRELFRRPGGQCPVCQVCGRQGFNNPGQCICRKCNGRIQQAVDSVCVQCQGQCQQGASPASYYQAGAGPAPAPNYQGGAGPPPHSYPHQVDQPQGQWEAVNGNPFDQATQPYNIIVVNDRNNPHFLEQGNHGSAPSSWGPQNGFNNNYPSGNEGGYVDYGHVDQNRRGYDQPRPEEGYHYGNGANHGYMEQGYACTTNCTSKHQGEQVTMDKKKKKKRSKSRDGSLCSCASSVSYSCSCPTSGKNKKSRFKCRRKSQCSCASSSSCCSYPTSEKNKKSRSKDPECSQCSNTFLSSRKQKKFRSKSRDEDDCFGCSTTMGNLKTPRETSVSCNCSEASQVTFYESDCSTHGAKPKRAKKTNCRNCNQARNKSQAEWCSSPKTNQTDTSDKYYNRTRYTYRRGKNHYEDDDPYADDCECGMPSDFIAQSRPEFDIVRNPITRSKCSNIQNFSERYCRAGGGAPACSNETILEKPLKSFRYTCPENYPCSQSKRQKKSQRQRSGAAQRDTLAKACRCRHKHGPPPVKPRPSIRSMRNVCEKRCPVIYKSMCRPNCRPKTRARAKYELTICYRPKYRCEGGKNCHYMASTIASSVKRRSKVMMPAVNSLEPQRTSIFRQSALPPREFSPENSPPASRVPFNSIQSREPPYQSRRSAASSPMNQRRTSSAPFNQTRVPSSRSTTPAPLNQTRMPSMRSGPHQRPERPPPPLAPFTAVSSRRPPPTLKRPTWERSASSGGPPIRLQKPRPLRVANSNDEMSRFSMPRSSVPIKPRARHEGRETSPSLRPQPIPPRTRSEAPQTLNLEPLRRAPSYLGTDMNPIYKGSFLKVRPSWDTNQTLLNPINKRTDNQQGIGKPKKQRKYTFRHAGKWLGLMLGDPFVGTSTRTDPTFSWKKFFSRSSKPNHKSGDQFTQD